MKKGIIFIILLSLILLSSSILVSASWFDKITGRAISDSCTDSDGGDDEYTRGIIVHKFGSNEDTCVSSNEFTDSCTGENCQVYEFSCQADGNGLSTYFDCPNGCKDGACLKESSEQTCTGSDGSDDKHTDGACLKESSEQSCTDSDGGDDKYTKGIIKHQFGSNEDTCVSSNEFTDSCTGENCQVYEFSCQADGNGLSTYFDCPDGCKDGACLKESSEQSCTDSDGGDDIYTRGVIVHKFGNNEDTCVSSNEFTDSCSGENCQIYEFRCQADGNGLSTYIDCPNGCKDGACIKKEQVICPTIEAFIEKENCYYEPIYDNNRCIIEHKEICEEVNELDEITILKEKYEGEYLFPTQIEVNGEFIFPDDKTYDYNYSKIKEAFYDINLDIYDFLIVASFGVNLNANNNMMFKADKGTGPIPDEMNESSSRLRGIVKIDLYGVYGINNQKPDEYFLKTVIPHEIGHNWCCFAQGFYPDDLNRQLPGHWVSNIDLFDSNPNNVDILGFNQWITSNDKLQCLDINNIDNEYIIFSDMTLYLMGLISPEEVPVMKIYEFQEESVFGPYCDYPNLNHTRTRELSIEQLISANGERIPSYENSQKKFKIGWAIVVPKNLDLDENFIDYVKLYENALPEAWEHATSNKSHIVTNNKPHKNSSEVQIEDDNSEDKGDTILCQGCFKENTCYPYGYRSSSDYCEVNNTFLIQKEAEQSCNNNFECTTNLCIDGYCVSGSVWQKLIKWLSRVF